MLTHFIALPLHWHVVQGERSCRLFRYVAAGNTGSWELSTSNATARFYNANEVLCMATAHFVPTDTL